MEVDPPAGGSVPTTASAEHLGLNPLKRSNSAPMLATTASSTSNTTCSSPIPVISTIHSQPLNTQHCFQKQFERIRRYSASSMCLSTPVKTPSRLAQIINEERLNAKEREAAHERETHTNLMISTSCEELSLSDTNDQEAMVTDMQKRPRSFQEPLHIFTSPFPYASSPSPTRLGKQCFSPSLCQPVRSVTLSPSPSPTRKTFVRRSISPISMAPSRIAFKRKLITDSDSCEIPHKRYQPSSTGTSPGCSTPEKFTTQHPLFHSVSSNSSMSDGSSPDQQVPAARIHQPIVQAAGGGGPSQPINHLMDTPTSQRSAVSQNTPPTSHQSNPQFSDAHRSMEHSGGSSDMHLTPSSSHQLASTATDLTPHSSTHFSSFQRHNNLTPGGPVFAFHHVHNNSVDSISTLSSMSSESGHSDMHDDSHLVAGTMTDLSGAGDFHVRASSKPSQV